MNSAIEWANGLAGHWARGMWPVLWQTAALAVIVGLIVLRNRRMSPALRFWLWMLVPLRLLVMPLITITLPVLAHPAAIQPPAVIAPPVVLSRSNVSPAPPEWTAEPIAPMERAPAPVVAPSQSVNVSLWSWLMIAWAVGVCLFSLRLARGLLKMRRIARQARENEDARIRDCTREAATMLGLRTTPGILLAKENVSPFVLGFLRPRIVLPAALADCVTPDELRTVLAHEFAHVRRRDALIGWVLACCDLIYFFNPVVHFVQRRIMFERERACDEQVLALAHAPRAVYARALLSAAGLSRASSERIYCAPVLLESSRHLERRLKLIGAEQRPRAGLSRAAKLCLLMVAVLALPGITCTERRAAERLRLNDSNLGQIIKAIITYQEDYNDNLPPSLADLFPKYLDDPKVLISPADKSPMKLKNGMLCSYRYIGNPDWRDAGPGFIVAYNHTPHDGGRNVAYFDGHVGFIREQNFKAGLAAQYKKMKPLMARPDFPGDRERVKAFCEDRDFAEEAAPLPVLVNEGEWAPNLSGEEPKIKAVWQKNYDTIHEIAGRDSAQTREDLRGRLANEKLPEHLRLLYAGILAAQQDKAGRDFLIKRANEATGIEQAKDVFWIIGRLDWLTPNGVRDDKHVDMDWAKDFVIAILSDDKTVQTGPSYTAPLQKRVVAMDMSFAEAIARIKDDRLLPLLVDLYKKRKDIKYMDSRNVLYAIMEMKDPRAEPFFLDLLENYDDTYMYAASALSDLKSEKALPLLLKHMDNKCTYWALAKYKDERILPAVKAALPNLDDEYTRRPAKLLLIDLEGGDRLSKLIECAKDPDFQDDSELRLKIVGFKEERALAFIADDLGKSSNLFCKVADIRILAKMKSPVAIKALINALDVDYQALATSKNLMQDNNKRWRGEIVDSLKKMTGQDFGVDKAKWLQWYNTTYH